MREMGRWDWVVVNVEAVAGRLLHAPVRIEVMIIEVMIFIASNMKHE